MSGTGDGDNNPEAALTTKSKSTINKAANDKCYMRVIQHGANVSGLDKLPWTLAASTDN